MPELPDLTVYREAIDRRVRGRRLQAVAIRGPALLKTVEPPVGALVGREIRGIERIGKRLVLAAEDDLFAVLHLMIAGRLHWLGASPALPRNAIAAWTFDTGTLWLSESSAKKRASLWIVAGREALAAHDSGGVEPLEATGEALAERLRSENHTLKRALTDPRLLAGIGNAYSDEILHRARLSPLALTSRLDPAEMARLVAAIREVLEEWTVRLRAQAGEKFPERVTAFRPEMAVHGRFGEPCLRCGSPVQRIAYSGSETNYCSVCQNEGRLLSDRALARLLRDDWPRTLAELEEKMDRARSGRR